MGLVAAMFVLGFVIGYGAAKLTNALKGKGIKNV